VGIRMTPTPKRSPLSRQAKNSTFCCSDSGIPLQYFVHVEYMDYVYGTSRVLTVFIL
jgi:hypothetical protein